MTVITLGTFALFLWMAHHVAREMRTEQSPVPLPSGDAVTMAARRYHAGRITAEEFDRIVAILRS